MAQFLWEFGCQSVSVDGQAILGTISTPAALGSIGGDRISSIRGTRGAWISRISGSVSILGLSVIAIILTLAAAVAILVGVVVVVIVVVGIGVCQAVGGGIFLNRGVLNDRRPVVVFVALYMDGIDVRLAAWVNVHISLRARGYRLVGMRLILVLELLGVMH